MSLDEFFEKYIKKQGSGWVKANYQRVGDVEEMHLQSSKLSPRTTFIIGFVIGIIIGLSWVLIR